jgi:hypothetical protein
MSGKMRHTISLSLRRPQRGWVTFEGQKRVTLVDCVLSITNDRHAKGLSAPYLADNCVIDLAIAPLDLQQRIRAD